MKRRQPRTPGRVKNRRKQSTARKCPLGKRRYRDHAEAVIVIQAAARTDGAQLPVRAYPCEVCHGWHLSSRQIGEA